MKHKEDNVGTTESHQKRAFVFEEGTKKISSTTFQNDKTWTHIDVPPTVTSIIGETFKDFNQLVHCTLPENIKSIAMQTFKGCTKLKVLAVPSTVEYINRFAFEETNLKCLILKGGSNAIAEDAFKNASIDLIIILSNDLRCLNIEAQTNCKIGKIVVLSDNLEGSANPPLIDCSDDIQAKIVGKQDCVKKGYYINRMLEAAEGSLGQTLSPLPEEIRNYIKKLHFSVEFFKQKSPPLEDKKTSEPSIYPSFL